MKKFNNQIITEIIYYSIWFGLLAWAGGRWFFSFSTLRVTEGQITILVLMGSDVGRTDL
jgi:hypothetical protein